MSDQHFIEEAKKAGMMTIIVSAIVQNERKEILLLEDHRSLAGHYRLPSAEVREGEGINQAMQRALIEETVMELTEVVSYLGHRDKGKERSYYFVIAVQNPYALEGQARFAYSWVDPQEGVGYPISDELREMIDLYVRNLK